jgi:response regulator NasT
MDDDWSGRRMARQPRPGERVRWKNPAGVVLKTRLGEPEVNEVWLALASTEPTGAQAVVPSRPLHILLADDDRNTRLYLREVLTHLGHEVLVTTTGRELVEMCRAAEPDLVITDIRMPELDGIQAALEVNRDKPVPFILLSAYHDAETLSRAAAEAVMAYLIKPVEEADLAASIAVAMSRFQDQQTAKRQVVELQGTLEDRKLIKRGVPGGHRGRGGVRPARPDG